MASWLLEDIGVVHPVAAIFWCDNRSAIQSAHNDIFHDGTTHIEIDCHFVRQHIDWGTIRLQSILIKLLIYSPELTHLSHTHEDVSCVGFQTHVGLYFTTLS